MTIVFLNGCTSSGKSSLAKALQNALPGLWLVSGIDHAIGMAPPRLHHHPDGFYFDRDTNGDVRLSFGQDGEALLAAHRRAAVAVAQDGVNLILDEVLATPNMRGLWLEAFRGCDVWFVGVHCDLDELERRELARGDRRVGQARGQFGKVHAGMIYDLEVDTTGMPTDDVCRDVMVQMASRVSPCALEQMGKGL